MRRSPAIVLATAITALVAGVAGVVITSTALPGKVRASATVTTAVPSAAAGEAISGSCGQNSGSSQYGRPLRSAAPVLPGCIVVPFIPPTGGLYVPPLGVLGGSPSRSAG